MIVSPKVAQKIFEKDAHWFNKSKKKKGVLNPADAHLGAFLCAGVSPQDPPAILFDSIYASAPFW